MLDFQKTIPISNALKVVFDPVQNANLGLFSAGDGCYVELIEPVGQSALTWNYLKKNGDGLHHICYEGLSLLEVDNLIREKRMLKIRGPIPAILFERDVVFAITRTKTIVEFLL